MNRTGFHIICMSLLFLGLMIGCKSSEKVATIDAKAAKAHSEFFDSMKEQAFRFNTLSARMNVDLEIPGKEIGSRVDLKMVKDSAFVLSVQPLLGMEMFRIEMNKDSIKIIDRMNKRYMAEEYSRLKGQTPIAFNFYNFQALFINHIFLPGEQSISPSQYNRFLLSQSGRRAEAKVKDNMDLSYTFMADGEEKLLSTYITNSSESYALQWVYKDFRLNEGQPFPMLMDVQAFVNGQSKGGIKMSFSKIQTDMPVQINTAIPEKYRRVSLDDLLKSFK